MGAIKLGPTSCREGDLGANIQWMFVIFFFFFNITLFFSFSFCLPLRPAAYSRNMTQTTKTLLIIACITLSASACKVSDKFTFTYPYHRGGLRNEPSAEDCKGEAKQAAFKELYNQANQNKITSSSAGSEMSQLSVEAAIAKGGKGGGSVVSVTPSYTQGSEHSSSTTIEYQSGVKFISSIADIRVTNVGVKGGDEDTGLACQAGKTVLGGGGISFGRRKLFNVGRKLANCERQPTGFCKADVTIVTTFQSVGGLLETGPGGKCVAPKPAAQPENAPDDKVGKPTSNIFVGGTGSQAVPDGVGKECNIAAPCPGSLKCKLKTGWSFCIVPIFGQCTCVMDSV